MPNLVSIAFLDTENKAFRQTEDRFIEVEAGTTYCKVCWAIISRRNTSVAYYNPACIQRGFSRLSYFSVRSEAFRCASTSFLVSAEKDFRTYSGPCPLFVRCVIETSRTHFMSK